YRDPQWMLKIAELRARLGEKPAAVEALRTAIIGAKAETSSALFEIAHRLDDWNMVPEAMEFAVRGAASAGPEFWHTAPGPTYARLLARSRQMQKALALIPEDAPGALAEAARVVQAEYSPEEKATLRPLIEARPGDAYTRFAAEAGMYDVEADRRSHAMMS